MYNLICINKDKDNIDIMYNLAKNYEEIEKNYEQMKIYYLMAIKLNTSLKISKE